MSNKQTDELVDFIRREWDRSVPGAVTTAAHDVMARYGEAALGVIFYGSCLRTGEIEDKILDFYVLVDSYKAAYAKRWLAIGNKILPPNVFYHEMDVDGIIVRSKYAVLSLEDFAFRVSTDCLNVSVWARFCQPCLLVAEKSNAVRESLAGHIATAITTMLLNLRDLRPDLVTPRDVWVEAFEQTYASELRSERRGKGLEIYLLDQERYDQLTPYAYAAMGFDKQESIGAGPPVKAHAFKPKMIWMLRRWNGKIVSFLRLLKASMTFDGGIDYLAWKIRRHSGVEIEVTDWMRRHPIMAGIGLFWRLRKKGAFK